MAVIKKSTMTNDVFSGISALYAIKGGFNVKNGAVDFSEIVGDLVELPVSESGGVSINGGTPSSSVFRVHGLNTPWTSRMTPGDAEVTLQVPTYNETVLNLIYGTSAGTDLTITGGPTLDGKVIMKGKAYGFPEKSVNLGLLIINDTEDKALFIKKIKVLASPEFSGEDTPFVVNLTGTVASGADTDAIAVLEPGTITIGE